MGREAKEAFELSLNLNLNIKCAAVKSVKLAKMKTVDEQQQPRQKERERERETHTTTINKTLVLPMEKILLMCRGRLQEGGGVHKKLISFIKVTRTEPTNQLTLEYVTYYIVYIYVCIFRNFERSVAHKLCAWEQWQRQAEWAWHKANCFASRTGGGNRHKSSSLKKLNGICIKLKNKSNGRS